MTKLGDLGKFLQQHLVLGFSKRFVGKQLLLRIHLVQVLAGDGRLVNDLPRRRLQGGHLAQRIFLQEPIGFVSQVDVDNIVPNVQNRTKKKSHLVLNCTELVNNLLYVFSIQHQSGPLSKRAEPHAV